MLLVKLSVFFLCNSSFLPHTLVNLKRGIDRFRLNHSSVTCKWETVFLRYRKSSDLLSLCDLFSHLIILDSLKFVKIMSLSWIQNSLVIGAAERINEDKTNFYLSRDRCCTNCEKKWKVLKRHFIEFWKQKLTSF